jgi:hypothetical protein
MDALLASAAEGVAVTVSLPEAVHA